MGLSAAQLKCIADAVASAEQKTAAEIRVVVSGTPVLKPRFFPLIWAGCLALLRPWGVQFLWPMSGLAILEIQALLFMVVAGVLLLPLSAILCLLPLGLSALASRLAPASNTPPLTVPFPAPPPHPRLPHPPSHPALQLVIAFHMEAERMGEFSAKEFKDGMLRMGADSVDKLRRKLPELRAELNSDVTFKAV